MHSSFKPVAHSDYTLNVEIDGVVHNVFVLKRPGCDEFMEEVARQCVGGWGERR